MPGSKFKLLPGIIVLNRKKAICQFWSNRAKTKVHIENYLSTRMDSSEALFVSSKAPHERLQIGGVEALLRKLGRELDLGRVHPHKFRRTLATKAIDKGMPIEQVQVLLGHKKIDTTLRYAMVDQRNVKASHRRYLT